jgi:hypothetical protein
MRVIHTMTRSGALLALGGLAGTAAAWAIILAARSRRQAEAAAAR